jgi:ankyrin
MIGLSWGPLHLAASYGLVDVLDWAHPEGIDFNVEAVFRSTPLWEATASGEECAVAVIVTKDGVDVNISNGLTPLVIAARDGHVGIVEILLRQVGIDVDKISSNGYSALDLAIKGRNEEIVRLLLEHGAKRAKSERRDLTVPGDNSLS